MDTGKRSYEAFWKQVVKDIAEDISEQEFSTWFRGVEFAGGSENQITLSVPSSFIKDQISQRYLQRIEERLAELVGQGPCRRSGGWSPSGPRPFKLLAVVGFGSAHD